MEISSVIPPGRRMIDGYPAGGFRISGGLFRGPTLPVQFAHVAAQDLLGLERAAAGLR